LPDEPVDRRVAAARSADAPASYAEALARWKTPEDVAKFIDGAFAYDRERALALAETRNPHEVRPAIHTPEAMFASPRGVCIDLARFGVETLDRIDRSLQARYLMLEFEPVAIAGRTLRRHWIATFTRDGQRWFFADSRRPGHVAGPYPSTEAFVAQYATTSGRAIVAWRETDSFARRLRAAAQRRPA
jgi:hypothetical protein